MIPYDQLAAIRLGFGLSPRRRLPQDPSELLSEIAQSTRPGDLTTDRVSAILREGQDIRQKLRAGDADAREPLQQHRRDATRTRLRAMRERFARGVDARAGFGERLAWFWADHFTVEGADVYQNLLCETFVDEAIRPHLNGRFADMMFAAETHPAMLRYLDQSRSVGPGSALAQRRPKKGFGLNENLAREMIELHSLGVGADYDQRDIEQLAELLAGLLYAPRRDRVFFPARSEPGPETVLGVEYGADGQGRLQDIRAVIRDLSAHPATGAHLARKMAVHFVADDPPEALVARLQAAFVDGGGDLGAMNRVLAEAPELADHMRAKMRQPFDYIVAGLRGIGVTGKRVRNLNGRMTRLVLTEPMALMGQPWVMAGGPDGWPEEGAAWGSPQGLAARINWSMQVPQLLLKELPDPRAFLPVALGDTASDALRWAVPKAESRVEGVGIVLASGDFNRR
ncbi:DUF1800 domain-containing protein [Paracoccus sp. 1_MG-2023]|uniref:DUF1800 domain-containing protein n=1 Tax=unclassified Paracoccus (in: a-proteobacteria) TaxID=2688777 RepID=UPI001C084DE8|nr:MULTISPECIES: DUF1800 domain-containing protein [unclassified Paracoccus (in: a-proteobacteria)]MBU2958161.1 DUF1800 domain-containing protein [Paracoccus sp. C2R09]MDO6668288.1 DUF1800 domain-containing protein [Paracoccus sp. 1_MG-2023]